MSIYTLTRYETVAADYEVEADTLDEAIDRLESAQEQFFTRSEDGDYFHAEDLRVLCKTTPESDPDGDLDWLYPGNLDGAEPTTEASE